MTDDEFEKWLSEAADEGKYFAERDCVPAVEVRALFAQLRAEQRWIPVTERLPTNSDRYVVYTFEKLAWSAGSMRTVSWTDFTTSEGFHHTGVTHWLDGMPPLPGAEGGAP